LLSFHPSCAEGEKCAKTNQGLSGSIDRAILGHMVASITEAKNQLSALIDRVRGGESVLIVDRGVPVARLESATVGSVESAGRLARLQRAGIVTPARTAASGNPLAGKPPRPRGGASIVQTLVQERREGR
jgi:prevent-host-death family protein